jgi:ribosomal protein S18 acetylase RimI-like enzyme
MRGHEGSSGAEAVLERGRGLRDAQVFTVEGRDAGAALDSLLLAFARDPVARWAWPEPAAYVEGFREFARALGGRAFEHGSAQAVEGFAGSALWLAPGVEPDEASVVDLLERSVPEPRRETVRAFMEEMGGSHPSEPHWYLPLIGVDPSVQGRGIGSTLLRHALQRVDLERRLAYLESTNPANLPLYERHGFRVSRVIQVGEAPPLFPMVREPR